MTNEPETQTRKQRADELAELADTGALAELAELSSATDQLATAAGKLAERADELRDTAEAVSQLQSALVKLAGTANQLADIQQQARTEQEHDRQANPLGLSSSDYEKGAEHIQQLANQSNDPPSWTTAKTSSEQAR